MKGDWITLLDKDLIFIQVEQNDEPIVKLGKKNIFHTLKEMLKIHHSNYIQIILRTTGKKTKDLIYEQFELQSYLSHP